MMKTDLPKRRSQQKRSRNFWRGLSMLSTLILFIGAGMFWAHLHPEFIPQLFSRYTSMYREQFQQWAQQKQVRLKTEIARFKPKPVPTLNDVHFQFYADLSNAEIHVQDDTEEEKALAQQKPPPPLNIEQTFNPDELTMEFQKSLAMK